jgi:hypothetical protein
MKFGLLFASSVQEGSCSIESDKKQILVTTKTRRHKTSLPFEVRMRLRFPLGRSPAPVTLCRLLQDVAVAELERQLQQWIRTINPRLAAAGVEQRLALDGKTLRGPASRCAKAAHLLAAFSHQLRAVIGQVAVDGKTNEITLVVELLGLLMIEGRLLTMAALLTQRKIAQEIIHRRGSI